MSNGLIIFLYCIAVYGLSNMVVFGSGPFRLFEHLRRITSSISEHFGSLFGCMMCFPANVGLFCSLINFFFIPVPITPFNIFLGTTDLWWLIALCDCCFTSGIVWLIHHIEEFFENLAEGAKNSPLQSLEDESDDIIDSDDITL